jgi:hypothetical protein
LRFRLPQGASPGVVVGVVFVAHLLLGVALLIVGAALALGRQRITCKEAQRGRTRIGATGWTVLGGILALNGVLQVALAVA